jgi:hypothetical protein
LLSYEKIRHIVEVDEKILVVFTIDSQGKTSGMFIAPDANIDKSFIEIIRSKLEFNAINKATTAVEEGAKEKSSAEIIGKHLWDIFEYDNIRVIKIYEANRLIAVLTRPHTSLGTTADTVLGYVYECNEDEQEKEEESPPCLF